MRYELSNYEWTAIKPMLPNKPRGVRRVNDRRVLNGTLLPHPNPLRSKSDISDFDHLECRTRVNASSDGERKRAEIVARAST